VEQIPNITEILTWPQAVFGIVIVISALVVPQIVQLIQNNQIRHELKPNSGSSVRDAIDRIEKKLDDHVIAEASHASARDRRLDKLEGGS
jgi:hypothetical protein